MSAQVSPSLKSKCVLWFDNWISCGCDRVHDIYNLNHVLIRNHWLAWALSRVTRSPESWWCWHRARTIHYRAIRGSGWIMSGGITAPWSPRAPRPALIMRTTCNTSLCSALENSILSFYLWSMEVCLFGNSLKVLLFMTGHKYDYGNLSRALFVLNWCECVKSHINTGCDAWPSVWVQCKYWTVFVGGK